MTTWTDVLAPVTTFRAHAAQTTAGRTTPGLAGGQIPRYHRGFSLSSRIVGFNGACKPPRLRFFVAVAAAVWVLAIFAHGEDGWCRPLASDSPRPVLSSLAAEFSVNADHAHLADGTSPACDESLAAAVLPQSATTLVALGLVFAVVAVMGWLAQPAVLSGRGPPRALGAVLTGQDLLTRFCLSRR